MNIEPPVLEFNDANLCMPIPKVFTITNTHPTDALEIRSIFTETETLEIKDYKEFSSIKIEAG